VPQLHFCFSLRVCTRVCSFIERFVTEIASLIVRCRLSRNMGWQRRHIPFRLRCDAQQGIVHVSNDVPPCLWAIWAKIYQYHLNMFHFLLQVFAERFPAKTLLIPVGGSSLAYRWWLYPPLHLHLQQQQQQQQHGSGRKDPPPPHLPPKSKLLSAVSSTKNETLGHTFRLEVIKYVTCRYHVEK
jgi:hypothetical protein